MNIFSNDNLHNVCKTSPTTDASLPAQTDWFIVWSFLGAFYGQFNIYDLFVPQVHLNKDMVVASNSTEMCPINRCEKKCFLSFRCFWQEMVVVLIKICPGLGGILRRARSVNATAMPYAHRIPTNVGSVVGMPREITATFAGTGFGEIRNLESIALPAIVIIRLVLKRRCL